MSEVPVLSSAAKEAIPEIVAYLRADADNRPRRVADGMHVTANFLELEIGIRWGDSR